MPDQKFAYNNTSNPEDMHKIALMTTPKATPVFSAIGGGYDVTNTYHEWLTDALAEPVAAGVIEGATITPTVKPALTRMGNYTQLNDKAYNITDTQQAIAKKNGQNVDIGTQMMNATIELKRNINKAILSNTTSTACTGAAAAVSGGIPFFLDHSNTTFGTFVNYIDAGTKALDENKHFIALLQKMYNVHDPEALTAVVSPHNKMAVNRFNGGAVRQTDSKSGTVYNDIKNINTPFGDVAVMIERMCPDTDVHILDMNYWKKSFLQPIDSFDISGTTNKTKHGIEKGVMAEWVIECRNVASSGRIINLA